MNTLNNTIDFSNQDFFMGLDVHKKQWTVTIRTQGMELKTFSMDPSPEQLAQHMHKHYPGGRYRSVYEAGFCGFWIHEALTELGVDNIVIHAADVPTTDKEKRRKSDRVDSRKLAAEREAGRLGAIYVPTPAQQELRSLARLRQRCVAERTRWKNRIKSHLAFYGHRLPDREEIAHWSNAFIVYLRELEFTTEAGADYLAYCIEALLAAEERTRQITRRLYELILQQDRELFEILLSVPGIGKVVAAVFFCELIAMKRFANFDHLCSYIGLVPSLQGSGERHHVGSITARHHRLLRALLIEAAWVAVRKDPVMLARFNELTRRMKKQEAIVRIARKLLRRVRAVWTQRNPYQVGYAAA